MRFVKNLCAALVALALSGTAALAQVSPILINPVLQGTMAVQGAGTISFQQPANNPGNTGSTIFSVNPADNPNGDLFSLIETGIPGGAQQRCIGLNIANGNCNPTGVSGQPTLFDIWQTHVSNSFTTASVTASISGTTADITVISSGTLYVGQSLIGGGVVSGTKITACPGGNCAITGNYTVNISQTVGSESMTAVSYNQILTDQWQNPGNTIGINPHWYLVSYDALGNFINDQSYWQSDASVAWDDNNNPFLSMTSEGTAATTGISVTANSVEFNYPGISTSYFANFQYTTGKYIMFAGPNGNTNGIPLVWGFANGGEGWSVAIPGAGDGPEAGELLFLNYNASWTGPTLMVLNTNGGVQIGYNDQGSPGNNATLDVHDRGLHNVTLLQVDAGSAQGANPVATFEGGSVIAGGGQLANAATSGFLYAPTTTSGAPTGAPTAEAGYSPIVIDPTDNRIYFWNGSAWKGATGS